MKHHYSIFYFISQAFKGLWRNSVMSYASILVLMCCLVVMGIFGLIVYNLNINLREFDLANDIIVYLEYDATDEDAARVGEKIRAISGKGIGKIEFISKQEALESMREKYSDNSALFEDIGEDDNPLPHSYKITMDDVSYGMDLQFDLQNLDDSVRKVSNRMDMAQQFESTKQTVTYAFTFFLIVLFFVCMFVIINTINMAVYSRRNEILLMRYVGATRWFISLPFVLEGIIIGAIASLQGYLLTEYVYNYMTKMIGSDVGLITLVKFSDISAMIFFIFVFVGLFTGILGSVVSLHKRIEV